MTEELALILIFKTNISTLSDQLRVQKLFADLAHIEDWHVDSEDVDCVLRIVTHKFEPEAIIKQLNDLGFECTELA